MTCGHVHVAFVSLREAGPFSDSPQVRAGSARPGSSIRLMQVLGSEGSNASTLLSFKMLGDWCSRAPLVRGRPLGLSVETTVLLLH